MHVFTFIGPDTRKGNMIRVDNALSGRSRVAGYEELNQKLWGPEIYSLLSPLGDLRHIWESLPW